MQWRSRTGLPQGLPTHDTKTGEAGQNVEGGAVVWGEMWVVTGKTPDFSQQFRRLKDYLGGWGGIRTHGGECPRQFSRLVP